MCLETIAFSLCFILLFSNAHLFYYPFFWCFVELYSKHYAIIMIDVFGTSKNFLSLRLIGVSEIAKKLYTQCIFFCVSMEKYSKMRLKHVIILHRVFSFSHFWITVDFAKMMSWFSKFILFDIYIHIYIYNGFISIKWCLNHFVFYVFVNEVLMLHKYMFKVWE